MINEGSRRYLTLKELGIEQEIPNHEIELTKSELPVRVFGEADLGKCNHPCLNGDNCSRIFGVTEHYIIPILRK